MNEGPYINRKDIARMCGCSIRQVQYNETFWGIHEYRRDKNKRVVMYLKLPTIQALVRFGALKNPGG